MSGRTTCPSSLTHELICLARHFASSASGMLPPTAMELVRRFHRPEHGVPHSRRAVRAVRALVGLPRSWRLRPLGLGSGHSSPLSLCRRGRRLRRVVCPWSSMRARGRASRGALGVADQGGRHRIAVAMVRCAHDQGLPAASRRGPCRLQRGALRTRPSPPFNGISASTAHFMRHPDLPAAEAEAWLSVGVGRGDVVAAGAVARVRHGGPPRVELRLERARLGRLHRMDESRVVGCRFGSQLWHGLSYAWMFSGASSLGAVMHRVRERVLQGCRSSFSWPQAPRISTEHGRMSCNIGDAAPSAIEMLFLGNRADDFRCAAYHGLCGSAKCSGGQGSRCVAAIAAIRPQIAEDKNTKRIRTWIASAL